MRIGVGVGVGFERGALVEIFAAPFAFNDGQWTLADSPSVGGDTLTINISALPFDGNSTITALEYRLNGGAATVLVGLGTGARDITVPATTLATVEIRAVNAIGNGAWSDLKSATPTVETLEDPPVLTQISYVGDDLELSIDIDGTGYWKWSASATPLSGAAIKAAPDGSEAWFGPGTVLETIADPGPGTWYLNLVAENVAGFSNVITITEVVPGQVFTETWSSYANGDTWTQLDTAYSRTSTPTTAVATDADGPASLGVTIATASTSSRAIWRDDIATALALRTTERVQFLFKVRMTSLANARCALGVVSASLAWGAYVYRNGSGWQITTAAGGDFTSVGAPFTPVKGNQSDSDVFYIRIEYNGNDVKVRAWEPALPESEGGTWTTETLGSAVSVPRCDMGVRVIGDGLNVLGYSVGIDADAPSF